MTFTLQRVTEATNDYIVVPSDQSDNLYAELPE